jgi:hypothetical protein
MLAVKIQEPSFCAGYASSHRKTSPNAGHRRHKMASATTRAAVSTNATLKVGVWLSCNSGHATNANTNAV